MADARKTELAINYEMSICQAGLAIIKAPCSVNLIWLGMAFSYIWAALSTGAPHFRRYQQEEGRNAALHPSPIHYASCRDCAALPFPVG